MMETMNFHDEVVSSEELDELVAASESAASDREVKMAQQLIDSLTTQFTPESYSDTYREKVLDLIERKAQGEEIAIQPEAAEPARVPDLMAALEASLAAVKSEPKPAKAPAKKPAAGSKKPAPKKTAKAA